MESFEDGYGGLVSLCGNFTGMLCEPCSYADVYTDAVGTKARESTTGEMQFTYQGVSQKAELPDFDSIISQISYIFSRSIYHLKYPEEIRNVNIWLNKRPQRYPEMPKAGIPKKTPAIRIPRPAVFMQKERVVFPIPLMML